MPLYLLRSKWPAGKARGASISEWICERRATPAEGHFQRNPPGREAFADFPRGSLGQDPCGYYRFARALKIGKILSGKHKGI